MCHRYTSPDSSGALCHARDGWLSSIAVQGRRDDYPYYALQPQSLATIAAASQPGICCPVSADHAASREASSSLDEKSNNCCSLNDSSSSQHGSNKSQAERHTCRRNQIRKRHGPASHKRSAKPARPSARRSFMVSSAKCEQWCSLCSTIALSKPIVHEVLPTQQARVASDGAMNGRAACNPLLFAIGGC